LASGSQHSDDLDDFDVDVDINDVNNVNDINDVNDVNEVNAVNDDKTMTTTFVAFNLTGCLRRHPVAALSAAP
jgi:hypothetical protein